MEFDLPEFVVPVIGINNLDDALQTKTFWDRVRDAHHDLLLGTKVRHKNRGIGVVRAINHNLGNKPWEVLFADSYRSVHHYDKESAQTKLSVLKFHDGCIVRMHNKAGLNETYARTNRLAAAGHFNEAIEELKKACELGLDFITDVDEDEPLATLRTERPYAWRELEESISAGVRPPEDGGAEKDGHLSVGQAKAFALELLALPNDAADTEVDKLIRKIRAPPAPAQDGALPVRSKPFTDPWGLHQLPFGSQDSIPSEDQGGSGSRDLPIVMC